MSSKKRSASRISDSDSDNPRVAAKPIKKSKITASGAGQTDKDGNPYWELSTKRRVAVSQFKGSTFVNIREYYEKNGESLPGSKGITLSIEQYEALVKVIPQINAALRQQGHQVENLDEEGGASISVEKKKSAKKERSKSKKSNIEATSDEDED